MVGSNNMRDVKMVQHILYTTKDFENAPDSVREGGLYRAVVEGGLDVCKACGDYEQGLLDNPHCTPRYTVNGVKPK